MPSPEKQTLAKLKSKSKLLKPIIRIGKNGLNENLIKEIMVHLKKRRLIKIKLLRNALQNSEIDEIINRIVNECSCVLIDRIGSTFSVYRQQSKS